MIEDWIDAMTFGLDVAEMGFKNGKFFKICESPKKMIYQSGTIKAQGKIIHQDDTTILKIGDSKFIARPEVGEKYDAEKGVLICIAKAMGLTTTDILSLCENAIVKKSKQKANVIKQDKKKK